MQERIFQDVYKRQSVDRAHNSALDRERIIQSLRHGSQAVGGAGSSGDDVVILAPVSYTHLSGRSSDTVMLPSASSFTLPKICS